MGFFIDTTMTFMNLLEYHFFDRFPDIKLIVPHAGAFLGILADRDETFVKAQYQTDLFAAMKHVYFDTAGAVFPRQLPMLLTLADEQHILYGSDIPYTELGLSSQLLSIIVDADDKKASRKMKLVQTAHRFDHFYAKHKKTRRNPNPAGHGHQNDERCRDPDANAEEGDFDRQCENAAWPVSILIRQ